MYWWSSKANIIAADALAALISSASAAIKLTKMRPESWPVVREELRD